MLQSKDMQAGFYPKKIKEIINLTPTVGSFILEKDNNFNFLPGQYIHLLIEDLKEFPVREFTVCSSPLEERFFQIVTKKGFSEFKNKLFSLRVGDSVGIKNPTGGFIMDEKNLNTKVFISGGMGITPFYSMIKYSAQKKLTIPIILFASFANMDDVIFYEELKNISLSRPNIKVVYFLTRETNGEQGFINGRINMELLKKYLGGIFSQTFYISGPDKMIDKIQEMLTENGVKPENIRVDYFNGYQLLE